MIKKFLVLGLIFSPAVSLAQGATAGTLGGVLDGVYGLVSQIVPILLVLALVVFFWGLIKYIWAAGDAEGKASGLKIMVGGIIALFVMASVWGLVAMLQESFDIDADSNLAPTTDNLLPN